MRASCSLLSSTVTALFRFIEYKIKLYRLAFQSNHRLLSTDLKTAVIHIRAMIPSILRFPDRVYWFSLDKLKKPRTMAG